MDIPAWVSAGVAVGSFVLALWSAWSARGRAKAAEASAERSERIAEEAMDAARRAADSQERMSLAISPLWRLEQTWLGLAVINQTGHVAKDLVVLIGGHEWAKKPVVERGGHFILSGIPTRGLGVYDDIHIYWVASDGEEHDWSGWLPGPSSRSKNPFGKSRGED
ncbi:hypothetical protein [Corynebacterium sp. TAE3-ERU16]|uniref:hypothetical protein n=1 Tax=Corynebacterium sp. TAE3-ERU16 TaxID=2849493 RepID=UPI001C4867E7|nr:hypothetical protein [Corynebacterium sp. TAE3-ERU16]MBV7292363.1 hypothetical protein [Corynebacterium sp. TAE3-ERU16]